MNAIGFGPCTVRQAASGRWWVACPRCEFYRTDMSRARVDRLAQFHDALHRGGVA